MHAIPLALILLLSACATIPKNTAELYTDDFSLLPEGGSMYLWADVIEAKPLLESISFDDLTLKNAGAILDRTATAAAVFSGAGKGERFLINLSGKYPTFRAGFSMAFSRDWKKTKSQTGNSYWKSSKFGIGVALDSKRAFVSTGDPLTAIAGASPAVRVPASFNEFRRGAVMAGWIPNPQEAVNDFLLAMGIPIQVPAEDFYFNIIKNRNPETGIEWELLFHIRTTTSVQARAIVTLFNLARAFMAPAMLQPEPDDEPDLLDFLPALFANSLQRDDDVLTLRSAAMSTKELALLFNAISLYSNMIL